MVGKLLVFWPQLQKSVLQNTPRQGLLPPRQKPCYISVSVVLSLPMDNIPDVEIGIPLPASAAEAMPELSPREELEMRARTIKLLSDISGNPIEVSEEDRTQALDLANKMLVDPKTAPALARYSNPTLAYLAGMVAQHDTLVVKELAELKIYVVNKLVAETEHPDAKVRLSALRSLGEVDGVDAFKKRSEVTIKPPSIEEVERELLDTLARLEKRTVDVSAKVIDVQDANESNA